MLDFSQRWTLWFESANHLGTWSAALLLIFLSLLVQPPVHSRGWRRAVFLIVIGLLTLWFALLVAWSASRAAWIAVAIGFLVLVLANRTLRTWSVVLAATCIIAIGILSIDRVRDRALTVAEMGQDGSSQSRPRTWGAACEMAAAHPWSGVGSGQFEYYYTNWYEPPERDDHLRTANSDLLHVMAERGAWAGVLLLTLYGLGMSLVRDGWKQRQMPMIGLGLATGSFFVCGLFNNVITFATLLPWVAAVIGLGIALVVVLNTWQVVMRRTLVALPAAGVVVVALLLHGNTRIASQPVLLIAQHAMPCLVPTQTPIRGTFLFVAEKDGLPRAIYRNFFSIVARQGWRCVIVEHLDDVEATYSVLPAPTPVVVMCLAESSTAMLIRLHDKGLDLAGVILCDNGFPEHIIARAIPCPMLFIHGRFGNERRMIDARNFSANLREHWPSSEAFVGAWGPTWQRLVPRLSSQITAWLAHLPTQPLAPSPAR